MITVVFASFNGEDTLPRMLESFTHLIAPPGGWKILAIDNNSNDNTKRVIESYQSKLPITYLFEGKPGKNHALNAALQYLEGELAVFTDDDVLPEPDWLIRLYECVKRHPDSAIFGGAILPSWAEPPATWITEVVPLGVTFALTAPSLKEGEISPGLIWGPNMAIRSDIFARGHQFNTAVGPDGSNNYAMGSETEFNLRLAKLGYKSYFCPQARVRHIIHKHQMAREWILKRGFRCGRNMYMKQASDFPSSLSLLLGVPRWMIRKLLIQYAVAFRARLLNRPKEYFEAAWDIEYAKGYFFEAMRNRQKRW